VARQAAWAVATEASVLTRSARARRSAAGEVDVGFVLGAGREETVAQAGVVLPEAGEGLDLGGGDAAVEVGAHVVRLGRRGVVDVAADVAVEIFGGDVGHGHEAGVAGHVGAGAIDVDDLGDVFGAQKILGLALAVFAVGVEEEDVAAGGGVLFVEHEHAGGDAGAVEEAGGQADDGFEPAVLDEVAAGLALLAAAEEHTVGHDGGEFSVGFEDGEHVLHEHEVGLLALLGHPDGEAAGIFDVFAEVVLGEGRVGEDAVEAGELVVLPLVLGAAKGVLLADVGVGDAVEEHVHLADGPGGADGLLAGEGEVAGIAAAFAHIVAGLDEHAAGAAGGIVNAHAGLGIDDLDEHAHDVGRGVEFAGLFAGGVGEEFDEVFVGGAEEVGELEVLVAEGDLFEVLDEVGEDVVVEGALADLAVEVDVFEDVLESLVVGVLDGFEGLVEAGADVGLEVAEGGPMGLGRDEEGVLVAVGELAGDDGGFEAAGEEGFLQLLLLLVEEVAQALQEKHAEDVFLVFRGIHVAAEIVAGAEEEAGELAEGEFGGHGARHSTRGNGGGGKRGVRGGGGDRGEFSAEARARGCRGR
jgi:hypothetical protein